MFEREWAASLLSQALDRLAQEYAIAGKSALFQALKAHLTAGTAAGAPYEEMAKSLGRAVASLFRSWEWSWTSGYRTAQGAKNKRPASALDCGMVDSRRRRA